MSTCKDQRNRSPLPLPAPPSLPPHKGKKNRTFISTSWYIMIKLWVGESKTGEKFRSSFTVVLGYVFFFLKTGPREQSMWYPMNSGDVKESLKIHLLFKSFFRILLKALMQAYSSVCQAGLAWIGVRGAQDICSTLFFPSQPFSLLKNSIELTQLQEPYSGHCWGQNWW